MEMDKKIIVLSVIGLILILGLVTIINSILINKFLKSDKDEGIITDFEYIVTDIKEEEKIEIVDEKYCEKDEDCIIETDCCGCNYIIKNKKYLSKQECENVVCVAKVCVAPIFPTCFKNKCSESNYCEEDSDCYFLNTNIENFCVNTKNKEYVINRYNQIKIGTEKANLLIYDISSNCICKNNKCELTPKELNKERCNKSGGTWYYFGDGCVDSCEKARASEPITCTAALTWGCECGPDKCWNSTTNKCEPNEGCPYNVSYNCMPSVPPEWQKYCIGEYAEWIRENCNITVPV